MSFKKSSAAIVSVLAFFSAGCSSVSFLSDGNESSFVVDESLKTAFRDDARNKNPKKKSVFFIESAFNSDEVSFFDKKGNATLSLISYINSNGITSNCSGYSVSLLPYTEYMRDVIETVAEKSTDKDVYKFNIENYFSNGYFISPMESNYFNMAKKKVCDSNGRVVFDGLPTGKYIAKTFVPYKNSGVDGQITGYVFFGIFDAPEQGWTEYKTLSEKF